MPRSGYLLAAQFCLLLLFPFAAHHEGIQVVFRILAITIGLTGLYAVSEDRRHLHRWMAVIPFYVVINLVVLFSKAIWAVLTLISITMVIYVYVMYGLVHNFMSHKVVKADTLCSAIAVYILIGIFFAGLYTAEELLLPGSFQGSALHPSPLGRFSFYDMLYFSFCTLTTVGYGDIVPMGPEVRSLSIIQQLAGYIYSTVMLARLVGMYQQEARPEK